MESSLSVNESFHMECAVARICWYSPAQDKAFVHFFEIASLLSDVRNAAWSSAQGAESTLSFLVGRVPALGWSGLSLLAGATT